MESRETGQQRRVDIQHAARVMLHELGRQNAHEARQHNEIGLVRVDGIAHRRIKTGTIGVLLVVHHARGNAVFRRKRQTAGVGTVRQHRRHAPRPLLGGTGPDDGFHVAATPGNQDHNIFHRRDSTKLSSKRLQSEHIRYLIHAKPTSGAGARCPVRCIYPCVMDCDAFPALIEWSLRPRATVQVGDNKDETGN
ncbi:hypothetical protein D3C81_1388490 [compost metagenome]